MRKIVTGDGSITYHNEKFDETYHSISGAMAEAQGKFIKPSDFAGFVPKHGHVVVLDVCFGLGYNTAAAIDRIRDLGGTVKFYALESDPKILKRIRDLPENMQGFDIVHKLVSQPLKGPVLRYKDNVVEVILLIGDARKTITHIDKKVDFVFHDPFSPKKCPELWTVEFFRSVAAVCKNDAVMTTYSCARVVRDNLRKAGFAVRDGPCVGRRAPSTIAVYQDS